MEDVANLQQKMLEEDFLLFELNKLVRHEFICAATEDEDGISSQSECVIKKRPKVFSSKSSCSSSSSSQSQEKLQSKRKNCGTRTSISDFFQRYFAKQTSLDNPYMSRKVKEDLKFLFSMESKFASNVKFPTTEMESIADKWLDTYAFRFYEVHNVRQLHISETIKLFPGYIYYPLMQADFLRDTKIDLKDLDQKNWENVLKLGSNSTILSSFGPCEKAIDFWRQSGTPVDAVVMRNVGMTLLVHSVLTSDSLKKLVIIVESLDKITDTFGKNLVMPTIVMVSDSSDFCRAKDIFVYIDKVVKTKVSDFYEAVIMCYGLYYLFWLNYDPPTAPLYRKLDEFLKVPEYTGYIAQNEIRKNKLCKERSRK